MSNAPHPLSIRHLKDSSLFGAVAEVRGYLANPHLDESDAKDYRAAIQKLESEIRRRDL